MTDPITAASYDICTTEGFVTDFLQLTRRELIPEQTEQLSQQQIKRLLESSAVLSLSEEETHQKLAYKIALYLLNQRGTEFAAVRDVAQLALTRLGDLPVIYQMINSGQAEDRFAYFAFDTEMISKVNSSEEMATLYLNFPEVLHRKIFNQVEIAEKTTVTLTDFQARVLNLIRRNYNIAFSAPTSAGKSYVLLSYLADRVSHSSEFSAIYIVPTKALVAEVQVDIGEKLHALGVSRGEYHVFTGAGVLDKNEIAGMRKKVLVLTQERLQEMLANNTLDFHIDLLVVDEAQQVANDSRGIVIEDSVEELIKKDPDAQKVIISPYINNLERFAEIFAVKIEDLKLLHTDKSPVAQNIFFVTFRSQKKPSRQKVSISLLLPEIKSEKNLTEVELTSYELEKIANTIVSKKAWIADNLIKEDQPTIIYCNTPGDCRKLGEKLISQSTESAISDELVTAVKFLKEHVHKDYYLADYLSYRVGYHYGNMPSFVRSEVKQLFEGKQIRYLACTSTLLEGVNLPAKNLILYKPRKGRKLPMDSISIRNLIGRAGRLQKDYYGKIYCINVEDWDSGTETFENKPENIESSSTTTLSQNADELIRYLEDASFAPSHERVKSMATSLLMKQLMNPTSDLLSKFKGIPDQEKLDTIRSHLAKIVGSVSSVDKNLMLRNRSIDPRFQFELYELLKDKNARIYPPFPSEANFYFDLRWIFHMIAKYLLRTKDRKYLFYSNLACEWIRGLPYRKVLENRIQWKHKELEDLDESERKKKINEIIEDLDDAIENKLRYDYTRGLKCYSDIISELLSAEAFERPFCSQLSRYLEAGASDERILFMIGAGLPRNVAIEIYETFRETGGLPMWTTVTNTTEWLRANNEILRNRLDKTLYRDVERVIGI
jgi:superfamily II DNA/RNA helicase